MNGNYLLDTNIILGLLYRQAEDPACSRFQKRKVVLQRYHKARTFVMAFSQADR